VIVGSAVAAAAVAVGIALAATSSGSSSRQAETAGDPVPVLGQQRAVGELPDLEFTRFPGGESDRLGAYEGRPLVINFFASWCTPCLAELPRFEQAYQTHGDEVQFLGLNLQDSPSSAAEVVRDTGLSYPIGVDPDGELFQALGGFGMPTTLFVAADGTVLERYTGELSGEELVAKLESYGMATDAGA
jgi:cytochrome c biogenesis protein CcmG/thiol:disulfide interchange protein DsbE